MSALHRAGVTPGRIVVMASEPFEGYSFAQGEQATAMPLLAVCGGVVSGVLGFALAWHTQTTYPLVTGGMPIVAAFPTGIVTYELTMMGAVLTTAIALLVGSRVPDWKPRLYDPEVANGKILIGVLDPSDELCAELENRLLGAGAEKIKVTGLLRPH